jgi:hypothetical protein
VREFRRFRPDGTRSVRTAGVVAGVAAAGTADRLVRSRLSDTFPTLSPARQTDRIAFDADHGTVRILEA